MKTTHALVTCLVLGATALNAAAQSAAPDAKPQQPAPDRPSGAQPGPRGDGGRGGALTPEKSKAAWEAQAKGVGAVLGLDESKITSLTKAYVEARTSHNAANAKLREEMADRRGEAGGPEGMAEIQKKMEDMNKAEREKFEKSLAGTLTTEQAATAMQTLGGFNVMWDRMTDAVSGFGLDAAKSLDAQKAMQAYVTAMSKARTGDREAMRTIMQEARAKLTESMKGILNAEQFAKFEPSMGGMRRQPGGPDGGGEPTPRRPGGGGG